jgi:DNA-binding NarL/FixJ family response regulator
MAKVSVLVCDDVAALRALVGLALGVNPSLEVVGEAQDGEEAIARAEELQPDVVLLDLAMPVMDGLEALPEIRRVSPRAKVVVLSGFDSGSIASEARKLGAVSYVEKGIDPFDLAQLVEEVAEAPVTGEAVHEPELRSLKAKPARR